MAWSALRRMFDVTVHTLLIRKGRGAGHLMNSTYLPEGER